jgi:hypothetical protein
MTGKHPLQDLTEADWASHRQEIQNLRSHLFKNRSPASLYIRGEADPIAPSVVVTWYPEPPTRTLLRGGLRFTLHFPGAAGPSQYSVQHWNHDLYWMHARYVDHRGASYSRFSLTEPFDRVPQRFAITIDTMAREFAMQRPASGTRNSR